MVICVGWVEGMSRRDARLNGDSHPGVTQGLLPPYSFPFGRLIIDARTYSMGMCVVNLVGIHL